MENDKRIVIICMVSLFVTGIPATFMFDRHGDQAGENCAFASAQKLDQMIRQMKNRLIGPGQIQTVPYKS